MDVRKVALVGGGVIGAGWAARLIENGHRRGHVRPRSRGRAQGRRGAGQRRPGLCQADHGAARRAAARSAFTRDVEAAVADADFVQESAPEREDLKIPLFARIDRATRPDVIIASSTSGLLAEPAAVRDGAPRAVHGRPPVQPGLSAAAGRDLRRRQRPVPRPSSGPPPSTSGSACSPCMCARRSTASSPTG